MKTIYFVTEGVTDQIVLEGLVDLWLAGTDFVSRLIQPPSSDYAPEMTSNLSEGWKGVLAWCEGRRLVGEAGRNEALRQADCLIVHVDADVAEESDFKNPPFSGTRPPAREACDWVRSHLASLLGAALPSNVVLCVPSMDLEAWVLSCLFPTIADNYAPVECRPEPASLLVARSPYRLIQQKDGRLRKNTARYREHLPKIVAGWPNCADGNPPRCPEAARFELEIKAAL